MKNVDIALHFHNNTFIIFINEIEKIIHCLMKPKRKTKKSSTDDQQHYLGRKQPAEATKSAFGKANKAT